MLVDGMMASIMEKVNLLWLTVMYTMVNGKMIKLMATVCIRMQTEPYTRDNGKMISNMVKAKRAGQMEQSMKASIVKAKSTVRES